LRPILEFAPVGRPQNIDEDPDKHHEEQQQPDYAGKSLDFDIFHGLLLML
jgi:hypothetical protein